jgi:hypothetical protein
MPTRQRKRSRSDIPKGLKSAISNCARRAVSPKYQHDIKEWPAPLLDYYKIDYSYPGKWLYLVVTLILELAVQEAQAAQAAPKRAGPKLRWTRLQLVTFKKDVDFVIADIKSKTLSKRYVSAAEAIARLRKNAPPYGRRQQKTLENQYTIAKKLRVSLLALLLEEEAALNGGFSDGPGVSSNDATKQKTSSTRDGDEPEDQSAKLFGLAKLGRLTISPEN